MYAYTYVRFVGEGDLPPGHDFLTAQDGEHVAVFLRRDRICERVLEEAWDAVRECSRKALASPIRPRDEVTGIPVPFDPAERLGQLTLVHSA